MSKIAIIENCAKCPHKEIDYSSEYFDFWCEVLKIKIPDEMIEEKRFPKDCPLKDAYQEQEQEYMDRVVK